MPQAADTPVTHYRLDATLDLKRLRWSIEHGLQKHVPSRVKVLRRKNTALTG